MIPKKNDISGMTIFMIVWCSFFSIFNLAAFFYNHSYVSLGSFFLQVAMLWMFYTSLKNQMKDNVAHNKNVEEYYRRNNP